MPMPMNNELLMHHRYAQGQPISCGVPHGCITAVVDDVRCPDCLAALRAETASLYASEAQPEEPYGEAHDLFEHVRTASRPKVCARCPACGQEDVDGVRWQSMVGECIADRCPERDGDEGGADRG